MSTQNALKKLFELRVVLEGLMETDNTLYEAMSHDVEEAMKLLEDSVEELSGEDSGAKD